MVLEKLILKNFRQFYDTNELEFSTNIDQNVTLIHGENGVGKTTILNSILWCLFEYVTPDFERPKDLINHEAIAERVKHCRVEVYFVHEGTKYSAQRIYSLAKGTTFRVYKIEGGNYRQLPGPNAFINSVLPKDMAPYFFFHGEGVASISEGKESEKFRKAVRTILGFTFAEFAISDLNVIRREYSKKIADLDTKNFVLKRLSKEEAELEVSIDRLKEKQANVVVETKDIIAKLASIEERLGASGNADVRRLKKSIEATERRLKGYQTELKRVNQERQALIEQFGWAVFGAELMDQGLEFIDESTLKGKIPAPYQDQFVEDLLELRRCICGRSLEDGSEEEFRVRALLETANSAAISQRVMKARSIAANLRGRVKEFLQQIADVEGRRTRLDKEIGFEEKTLSDLEEEWDDIDEKKIKRLTEIRNGLRSKRNTLVSEQGELKAKLARGEERLQKIRHAAAGAGANNAMFRRLSGIRDGVDEIIERCSTRLDDFENSARSLIAHEVNEFLKEFSRKDYEVRVTESFEFYLARTDGQLVAKSKGEKLLLNLAFVSALIRHARMRQKATGNFLVRGTVAPFVIDAPFGELDDTYRKATAELLPPQSEQIVFMLSSSHWTGTVDEAIRNRVAKEYVLVSNRRGAQGSKPTDTMDLGSKTIAQSRYEQERDCTTIERIN